MFYEGMLLLFNLYFTSCTAVRLAHLSKLSDSSCVDLTLNFIDIC